ncbi:sugar deacetylase [Gordoniibacillus kamchatkensis]|uniref:Sugar deacetylase n=1 Tax=Gordoniibacillus kamchatkensis TaxID=1590651 RepID=A0ABR5AGZ4_9BACL|nr:divergent polysaccharide deacetylase family protein [Paenibacillus sp. VKM B-2647]KIL40294.1 sugar deacetylase [Paenibacillus sp. VKM B-2647]
MNRHKTKTVILQTMSLLLLWGLCPGAAWAEPAAFPAAPEVMPPVPAKKLAIVIDDLGNGMAGTEDIIELPIPLTVAIMPFLSTTKRDAEWAHAKGKAVIVHLPMEPLRGMSRSLGPGAITTNLSDEEIRRRVEAAIDEVPFAEGVNNHMGSKATSDERVMRIVLEVCKERGLIFLDSKTNYFSVTGKIARELGVKYVENELFLDDVASAAHVQKQVGEIKKRLQKQETCVVIGHVGRPGKKTPQVLREAIPELERQTRFVTVRELAR